MKNKINNTIIGTLLTFILVLIEVIIVLFTKQSEYNDFILLLIKILAGVAIIFNLYGIFVGDNKNNKLYHAGLVFVTIIVGVSAIYTYNNRYVKATSSAIEMYGIKKDYVILDILNENNISKYQNKYGFNTNVDIKERNLLAIIYKPQCMKENIKLKLIFIKNGVAKVKVNWDNKYKYFERRIACAKGIPKLYLIPIDKDIKKINSVKFYE